MIIDFDKYVEARYLASVLLQSAVQASRDLKDRNQIENKLTKEWTRIIQNSDSESIVKELMLSLDRNGIHDVDDEKTMQEILRNRSEIVAEVRRRVAEENIPVALTTRSPEDLEALVKIKDPYEEAIGQEKVDVIARDISWRIFNRLLDEKYPPRESSRLR